LSLSPTKKEVFVKVCTNGVRQGEEGGASIQKSNLPFLALGVILPILKSSAD